MLTLASMLRGGAQSEMPIDDRPMSRAQRLREWLASRNQPQQEPQQFPIGKDGVTPLFRPDLDAQPFPPGKDGVTPLFRPDLDARPNNAGQPGGFTMNPLGPGGLEGLPPGIMAILAARMGANMGDRQDGERKPDKFPPGKDGITPLMIDDRSLMGRGFGKQPGGY